MAARSDHAALTPPLPITAPESGAGPLLDAFPNGALPPGMDFNALLAEGIEYTQRMSSDKWTDYNEHDPGLTILEQLCYALTDLGLRGQYKIEDLLADERGRIACDTLFTGDRILTGAPLTQNDYRKIVYDRVPGLKNFWLEPVQGDLPGLYRGLIEKFKWGNDKKLISQVSELLRANRTLGEDIVSVRILKQQALQIAGQIQLMPGYDADEVIGEVLFNLDFKLVPGPTPMVIDKKVSDGVPFDAIYEGPPLKYGTIDDASLVARPGSISLQQIASIVQGVDGVRTLTGLRFLDDGGETLRLEDDSVPFIDVPAAGKRWPFLAVDASGRSMTLNRQRVKRFFLKCRADVHAKETAVKLSTETLDYRRRPSGRYLDIERYHSIQHQFPVTYGLSRHGIPDYFHWQAADAEAAFSSSGGAAGERRAAQVKQLRAYLLLFEQVLANAFSQLANARWLFSLRAPQPRSYFFQPLADDPPHTLVEVLRDRRSEDEAQDGDLRWRHIVSVYRNHALPALRSVRIAGNAQARRLAQLIAERSMAPAHYRITNWGSGEFAFVLLDAQGQTIAYGQQRFATLAEAEDEVRRLAAHMRRAHAEHRTRRYVKLHRQGAAGMHVIRNHGQIVLSAYWPCPPSVRTARVDEVLYFGRLYDHYAYRRERGGEWRFVLLNDQDEQIAEGQLRCDSEDQARHEARAVAHLIEHIEFDNQAYLRHVQLLPDQDEQPPHETVQQNYHKHLKQLMAQFDAYPQRRNAFLNHLLARFGESFDDELLQSFDPRPANGDAFLLELASWKISFLSAYPLWSARRGCGFNYGYQRMPEMPFGSGLEHRLYSLLGVGGAHHFARHRVSRPRLTSTRPGYKVHEDAMHDNTAPAFEFIGADPDIMATLLKYGTDLDRYQVKQARDGSEWRLYFVYPGERTHQVMTDVDKAHLLASRDRLIAWLQRDGAAWEQVYDGEGLYVLEHILLRPLAPDAAGKQSKHADFYGFRLSVLLPAWPMRFRNPQFRKHAETLVASSCPAHMAVDCHWLEFEQMQHFEELYADWAAEKYLFTRRRQRDAFRLDHCSRELRHFLQQLPRREFS